MRRKLKYYKQNRLHKLDQSFNDMVKDWQSQKAKKKVLQ